MSTRDECCTHLRRERTPLRGGIALDVRWAVDLFKIQGESPPKGAGDAETLRTSNHKEAWIHSARILSRVFLPAFRQQILRIALDMRLVCFRHRTEESAPIWRSLSYQ